MPQHPPAPILRWLQDAVWVQRSESWSPRSPYKASLPMHVSRREWRRMGGDSQVQSPQPRTSWAREGEGMFDA